jgi:hypothetical protein
MIGPGGLLLVVSHLFAVSILVLCVGLEFFLNNNNKNCMCKFFFLQGYILSTAGDALTSTIFKSGRYIEKALAVKPMSRNFPKKTF